MAEITNIDKTIRAFPIDEVLEKMRKMDWQYRGEPVTREKLEGVINFVAYQLCYTHRNVECGTGGIAGILHDNGEFELWFTEGKNL